MSEARIHRREGGSQQQAHQPLRSLRDDAARLSRGVREQIDRNPMLAVVASLCAGFALGGGIPRGTLTLLLAVGARAAGSRLGETILERAPRFQRAQEDSE